MSGPPVYSPRVRELFAALPGSGELAAAPDVTSGEAVALERGAWVRFSARVEDGRIAEAAFQAWGCPHTLAAAALAAGRLPGLAPGAAPPLDARSLAAELDAPAEKLGRLLIVEDALRALLKCGPG